MVEDGRISGGFIRRKIKLRFVVLEPGTRQELRGVVENRRIAGHFDIVGYRIGEPQKVVRAASAYAGASRWMPPVLNVPIDKLAAGGPNEMLAGQPWCGIEERQDSL